MKLIKACILTIVSIAGWSINSAAQEIEHNYLVGPQYTDCDSLKIEHILKDEAIRTIKGSTFRYTQNFKLTRRQGLMAGAFYSCDNETGYLIIQYDKVEYLYFDMTRKDWELLKSSKDPEGFYLDQKVKWISAQH